MRSRPKVQVWTYTADNTHHNSAEEDNTDENACPAHKVNDSPKQAASADVHSIQEQVPANVSAIAGPR